jgi:hypothetical protein
MELLMVASMSHSLICRNVPWLQLEQMLNQIVSEENSLGVISGPLFLIDQPLSTTINTANLNPAAYFKVILADSGIAAFVFSLGGSQAERFVSIRRI